MKMSMKSLLTLLVISSLFVFVNACSTSEKEETATQTEEITAQEEEQEVAEEDISQWHIHEDGYGKVALRAEKTVEHEGETKSIMEPVHHDLFKEKMEPHYVAYHDPIEITEVVIPITETETITAYNQKGKQKGSIQVVHDSQTGEIISVAYHDKHHKDEYDVTTGMTAKEVKKLRKELKHMQHRGKHFLYSDVSNIMYLLEVNEGHGNEYTEAEMDELVVQAIVWKDKKHHDDMMAVEFLEP